MSLTIMAEPSVFAFFEGDEVGVDVGLCRDVGEDRVVPLCGQLAAQCPTWPHLRHLVALAR